MPASRQCRLRDLFSELNEVVADVVADAQYFTSALELRFIENLTIL